MVEKSLRRLNIANHRSKNTRNGSVATDEHNNHTDEEEPIIHIERLDDLGDDANDEVGEVFGKGSNHFNKMSSVFSRRMKNPNQSFLRICYCAQTVLRVI